MNHLFVIIMNDMNSDDNLSKEDDNHAISLCDIVRQRQVRKSMGVDLGPDAPPPGRVLYHGGYTESRFANPDS